MKTKIKGDETMSGKKMATYLTTAAVALALGALVASNTANAGGGPRVRLTCELVDDTLVDFGKVDFEDRNGRRKFSIEVEDVPAVTLDTAVATVALGVEGQFAALDGLDFDDTAGDPGDLDRLFPQNFPSTQTLQAGAGALVEVDGTGVDLSCRLGPKN